MSQSDFSHSWSSSVLLLATVLLAGCVNTDMSDLDAYTQEVLARKSSRIEPLPEIKPYERYLYQSADNNLRDPFEPFYEEKKEEFKEKITDARQQKYIEEIRNRNREELEQFELDSLRMVGTLEDQNELWGIIKDNNGVIHRVKTGNYLGVNYGKIISIAEEGIQLREIVKDTQGNWDERQASLALIE
jgi:type IV pilus assembly protein PilP